MTTENTNNLVVLLDAVGRTILGETVSDTDTSISLKNPVVLHVVPADNQGKMSVQLLPLFFKEFLADKTADVVFNFGKDRVTTTNIDAIDFRLKGQYAQMFNPQNIVVPPSGQPDSNDEKVVNLFDE